MRKDKNSSKHFFLSLLQVNVFEYNWKNLTKKEKLFSGVFRHPPPPKKTLFPARDNNYRNDPFLL